MKINKSKFKQQLEQPNSLLITPIEQDTITLNDRQLTIIPAPSHSKILHLHLSHNKILSLTNINLFPCLQSFNISHNLLPSLKQFNKIVDKSILRRLNVRHNKFEQYGYQDRLIEMFPNLESLDHIKLNNRRSMQKNSEYVRENYLKCSYIIQRILGMLSSFCKQSQVNRQLTMNKNTEFPSKEPAKGMLKLLYENISQKTIYQLTNILTKNNQIQNKSLSTILNIVVKIIELMLPSDVKCTCRPFNLRKALLQSYSNIFDQMLMLFSNRYHNELYKYLQSKATKPLSQNPNQKKTEMMKQLIKLQPQKTNILKSMDPGDYIQKVNVVTMKSALIEVERSKNSHSYLTSKPYNYKFDQMKKQINAQEQEQFLQIQEYVFRFPIFTYSPDYLLVIATILINKIEKILKLHTEILLSQTSKEKSKNQKHISQRFQQKENMNTNIITTKNNEYINEISFEKTLPESTKGDQTKSININTTKRKYSTTSNTPGRLPAVPKFNTVEELYQISLKYKTFEALLLNIKLQKKQQRL